MLKTTIHIPEGQIAGVHVGNEASITLPAYPGKKLIAKLPASLRLRICRRIPLRQR